MAAEMGIEAGSDGRARCWWCLGAPELIEYHDKVWGQPMHGERELFEMLVLESFQSGLSWLTILRKREGFRRAFEDWDLERITAYGEAEIKRLLADPGIVRHRGKIEPRSPTPPRPTPCTRKARRSTRSSGALRPSATVRARPRAVTTSLRRRQSRKPWRRS
jgi:methyladenine glycosylase